MDRIGKGYPHRQLAKAFVTALSHEDEATRRRAEERSRRWAGVLRSMSEGTLDVGSRTPVKGLPAWVTPEVVRGGFATGAAEAGGPLTPHEREIARRTGVPAERGAIFYHHLTDEGLAELNALLDSGRYVVRVPEEAALLTVAWLVRADDVAAAVKLVEAIEPFADRLRFVPVPSDTPPPDGTVVRRENIGAVREKLAARKPNPRVAAMHEALTIWNPFADDLLAHWLETVRDGEVAATEPDGWRRRGVELLERYRRLADEHTLCGKHRKPGENLAILRMALEEEVEGDGLSPRGRGRLRHAVDSMVRKRGIPGSSAHAELRAQQAAEARRPTYHALAQLLVARLSELPDEAGLPSTEQVLQPVTDEEERRTRVSVGAEFPGTLRRVVDRALTAPVGTLVERGVIPSAEVLGELVPQLVASATADAYADDALRTLMAAVHRVFSNRRSLLLLDLQHQVRIGELPWVQAVARHHRRDAGARARTVLVQLGELALQGFPATILPNPLVRQLGALAARAGMDVPLVEELAADIFMGTFSGKFLRAAKLAADVLEGTPYERYYGIDYAAVRAIDDTARHRRFAASTSETFASLCRERAGNPRGYVAANGMVIEQAQILTTHNLAALVYPIGVDPSPGWADLARRAFTGVCRLVGRVHNNPYAGPTIKDAAYAWRQAVFFLSLCGLEEQITVVAWMQDEARRQPGHVERRLAPVLAGLRHVLVGGDLDDGSAPPDARRLLGWDVGRHWMSDDPTRPAAVR